MFFKADREESASWAVDIGFKPGDFEGNEISPSICINLIDTDKSDVKELVGTTFWVKTVEESEEREDSFYIYENEPLIEYRIEVLDIAEAKAHIKCNGVLILDGYAEPWIEEGFEIDSWVPVIESAQDWNKLYLWRKINLLRRRADLKEYIIALEQELSSVENGSNISENPWAMLYEISVRSSLILFRNALFSPDSCI